MDCRCPRQGMVMSNRDLVASVLPGRSGLTGWALVDRQMQLQIEAGVTTERHWRDHLESAGLMPSWERYNAFKLEHPDVPVPAELNRVQSVRDMRPGDYRLAILEAQQTQVVERRDLA